MKSRLRQNQKGDTIIEVVIAIVIVSIVLVGAYTSATGSLNLITEAQQHMKALGLAQNQVEDLRAKSTSLSSSEYSVGSKFCFNSLNIAVPYVGATPPACTQGIYTSEIISQGNNYGTGNYQFQVYVTYPSITGATGNVGLLYRVAV